MLFGGTREDAEARLEGELGWQRAVEGGWNCPECAALVESACGSPPQDG
jgi:hypothetical protein